MKGSSEEITKGSKLGANNMYKHPTCLIKTLQTECHASEISKGLHQIPSNVHTNCWKVKTLYVSREHLHEWVANFGRKQ